jgi:hypothetical protein
VAQSCQCFKVCRDCCPEPWHQVLPGPLVGAMQGQRSFRVIRWYLPGSTGRQYRQAGSTAMQWRQVGWQSACDVTGMKTQTWMCLLVLLLLLLLHSMLSCLIKRGQLIVAVHGTFVVTRWTVQQHSAHAPAACSVCARLLLHCSVCACCCTAVHLLLLCTPAKVEALLGVPPGLVVRVQCLLSKGCVATVVSVSQQLLLLLCTSWCQQCKRTEAE